jgi:uncharacterized protein with PIN domain
MNRIYFRFYGELNDFLVQQHQAGEFIYPFLGSPSVKDLIEAVGVPHPEVDLVLVNSHSVDFSYRVPDRARISVFPSWKSIDISGFTKVRSNPPWPVQFILDGHLSRLAAYLRLFGFDAFLDMKEADPRLAQLSESLGRVLLTRDIGLLKRRQVQWGYWVRETDPKRQIVEVLRRFSLMEQIRPFVRCLNCNSFLKEVRLEEIRSLVSSSVQEKQHEFFQCMGCKKVYWKGTHYHHMEKWIGQVVYENALTTRVS